ncbi:50S ribosomal protein L15 [Candidatus Wolfebacteria bacterium]|nr:50S ribosomal protein L15 [Candidatus Wolfebacteria bacterium]
MQLHQIQPKYKLKKKKRVGRGGKRGTYSGKGMKGQKSRAGRKIRPAERDLIQRLPKLRGFKFKANKKPAIINIVNLEKNIEGNIINRETLLKAGLIKKTDKKIKILAQGELKKAFSINVKEIEISENAKKKIETAGGTIS